MRDTLVNIPNLLILLLMTSCPLYVAYGLVSRYYASLGGSAFWAAVGIISISLINLTFRILGHCHILYGSLAALMWLGLAACAHILWKPHCDMSHGVNTLTGGLRWTCRSRGWPLAMAGGLMFFFTFGRALLMPPLAWDSLTYHLVFAGQWLQEHGLVSLQAPDGMDGYSHFPINGEIMAAWAMLPFHSDLLANVISFPFLLLGGICLYALGRELGLDRGFSAILAALVCFSPMIFAYVTTAYVDIQVFGELICATLFFLRYLRQREKWDLFLVYLSMGLAIGTKLTAVTIAALISGILAFYTIKNWRTTPRLSIRSFALICLSPALLFGSGQYLENWKNTGNPFYPYRISIGTKEVFKGSLYVERVTQESPLGTFENDLTNLKMTFITPLKKYSRYAGPKYVLFLIVTLVTLWRLVSHPADSRLRILLIISVAPLVSFYLDTSVHSVFTRRYWPLDTSRFLAFPLAITGLIAMTQLSLLIKWMPNVKFLLAIFVVADWLQINFDLLHPSYEIFLVLLVILSAALLGIGICVLIQWPSRSMMALMCLMTIALLVLNCRLITQYRDDSRWAFYWKYTDLHDFPRNFVSGWERCDEPGKSRVIALATGWAWRGHNWFFYPLMGRNLQNRVTYASINHRGIVSTHVDRGLLRETGEFGVWMENLRMQKVDYIFIQEPWPVEFIWIARNAQYFELEYQDGHCLIYRVKKGTLA